MCFFTFWLFFVIISALWFNVAQDSTLVRSRSQGIGNKSNLFRPTDLCSHNYLIIQSYQFVKSVNNMGTMADKRSNLTTINKQFCDGNLFSWTYVRLFTDTTKIRHQSFPAAKTIRRLYSLFQSSFQFADSSHNQNLNCKCKSWILL